MFKEGFKAGAGYIAGGLTMTGVACGVIILGLCAVAHISEKLDEHKIKKEEQKDGE